ncbi:hypothetical protein FJZ36_08225 [Candidatus Poribacteria bacterium]|nr:hypothetical protein [Candidatus Poribacteria bacterium]
MSTPTAYWFLLAVNVALTVFAQTCLREGMRRIGESGAVGGASVVDLVRTVLAQPFVLAGLLTFGVSVVLWLALLMRMKLSVLYPIQQSLIFIALELVAWRWLGEGMALGKMIGVLLICVGVYVVAQSG